MTSTLFKSCGVCGRLGGELTESSASRIATAFGAWLRQTGRPRVLVACDARAGGAALRAGAVQGLRDTGATSVDLGVLPAPVLRFAERTLPADAVLYVTAGDRPADFNGMRFSRRGLPLMPDDLAAVCDLTGEELTIAGGGGIESAAVPLEYQTWLLRTFGGRLPAAKVVLDAGSGAWAGTAARYLVQLGLTVVALPATGEPPADPFPPQAGGRLAAEVIAEKADLGIALDGDGDRMAAVDEAGRPVPLQTLALLLLREAAAGPLEPGPSRRHEGSASHPAGAHGPSGSAPSGSAARAEGDDMLVPRPAQAATRPAPAARAPSGSVVVDIRCGRAALEEIAALGLTPQMVRSGDAHLHHQVKAADALLGLSAVGHLHWRELDGGADGLYAALRLLAALHRTGKGLAALAAGVKAHPAAPEIRLPCPAPEAEAIERALELTFADEAEIIRIDGIRLEFEAGSALVRPSADGTALTLRFEGRTPEDLADVMELVGDQLPADMADAVRAAAG